MGRLQLPPGNYCVIPTTFRPGQESRFLVRTFVERHWGASGQAAGQSVVEEGGEGGSGHQLGRRMTRNVINIPILREEGSAPPGGGEEERQGEGGKRRRGINWQTLPLIRLRKGVRRQDLSWLSFETGTAFPKTEIKKKPLEVHRGLRS